MLNAAILTVVIATGVLLASPRLAKSTLWRATITPLASIIGSGFLVLGPILEVSFGLFAPLVMLALTAVAYAFGAAIRYNIRRMDMGRARSLVVERIEKAASVVLAFAYVISVAYYLNLFGSFGVSLTSLDSANDARVLTTAVFAVILFVGWTKGFAALERMEQVSVGLKLTIIAGLLFGLAVHFAETVRSDGILFNPAQVSGWSALTLVFGLIVTVQGFETSRYLGDTYDAKTRIRSMKLAQILSAVIYVVYIVLLVYAFVPGTIELDETAIIGMMQIVAPILPVLLVARSGLGTLNHTLLSLEALRLRQIPVLGVRLNGPDHPNNLSTLAHLAGVPMLGCLPPLTAVNAATLAQQWQELELSHKLQA